MAALCVKLFILSIVMVAIDSHIPSQSAVCENSGECALDEKCYQGKCRIPHRGSECNFASDCLKGQLCISNRCDVLQPTGSDLSYGLEITFLILIIALIVAFYCCDLCQIGPRARIFHDEHHRSIRMEPHHNGYANPIP